MGFYSECCSAEPNEFFDIDFDLTFQDKPSGICGDCKEHCEFEYDEE
jgi:hypothetical protein